MISNPQSRATTSESEKHSEIDRQRLGVPGSAFDYYKVLNLDRSVDDSGIKKAFRKLSLKYHPDRNQVNGSEEIFTKIAEAYDVLSCAKKRAVYDQYGHHGLVEGVPPHRGYPGYEGGYKFHGDAEKVFSDFFGGKNPFADFFSVHTETGRQFGSKLGGMHGMNKEVGSSTNVSGGLPYGPVQDPPIEHELLVTLEDLYLGAIKKMRVSRKVFNDDRVTTSSEDKILTIEILRGWKEGTRVIFEKEGDRGLGVIPADIVFIVKQISHRYFERRGDDLVYTTDITLLKALTGTIIDIMTLDGRHLKIPANEIIRPGYLKEIPGEGMPLSKNPEIRGRLLIEFRIQFPTYLNHEQKILIRKALDK